MEGGDMMDILGINVATAAALSVIVVGVIQWIKVPMSNNWLVRVISLVVSFAAVALITDYAATFDWQIFVKTAFAVFFVANGIWHTADQVGRSTLGK
jgi:hypothetical protein